MKTMSDRKYMLVFVSDHVYSLSCGDHQIDFGFPNETLSIDEAIQLTKVSYDIYA